MYWNFYGEHILQISFASVIAHQFWQQRLTAQNNICAFGIVCIFKSWNPFGSSKFLHSVAHGLRNLNASEVSSCTEKKDGVEYTADLAMDGDALTCAKTCYQKGGWIRVTLPRNDLVNKIKIRGGETNMRLLNYS